MDFIEQAHLPGEGRFTIDLARAQELMARYALPDRSMYILRLVQWAVASGATAVHVTLSRERVEVAHDGEGVPGDLNLGTLVTAQGPLHHLAVGVFSALGQGATGLAVGGLTLVGETVPREGLVIEGLHPSRMQVPWGAGAIGVIWVLTWFWLFTGPGGGIPVTLIMSVIGGRAGWNYMRIAESMRADWVWVRTRCRHAPVPVWLNGKSVSQPLPPGQFVPEEGGGLAGPEGACRAVLRLHPISKHTPQTKVSWLKDGVIVEEEEKPPHLGPRIEAVVDASGLDLDLAGFAVVKDDRYQGLLERLGRIPL